MFRQTDAWSSAAVLLPADGSAGHGALFGYRVPDNFMYWRFLFVDDLVASSERRRHALGSVLINALRNDARSLEGARVFERQTQRNSRFQTTGVHCDHA